MTFRLYELDCSATEDAGTDGDEPYLWVLGFKVDADTLDPGLPPKIRVQVYRGAPASPWVVGAGHVKGGNRIAIPPALGTRSFRLRPALVPVAGWFPGLAGVICLLWDQDGMAPRTSEAGHARFDAKFGGALADELNGLLAGAYDASLGTPGPDGPTLAWRLDRLRDPARRGTIVGAITDRLRDRLTGDIKDAVTDAADWDELIDTDDLLGVQAQVYFGDELTGYQDFSLSFTDDEANYRIRGQAGGSLVHSARILATVTHVERRLEQVRIVWARVCWFAARDYLARAFRLRTTTRFVLDTTIGGPPRQVRWYLGDTPLDAGSGSVVVHFEGIAEFASPPADVLAPDYPGGPAPVTYTANGPVLDLHAEAGDGVWFGRVRAVYNFDGDPDLQNVPDAGYERETQTSITGVELSMDRRYHEAMAACKRVTSAIDRRHIAVNLGKLHIDPGDPPADRETVRTRVDADVRALVAAGLEPVTAAVVRP
ncbi:hypothetical protein GCM10018962_53480 [Dactylosporangium matsuzakiense]|uniref:Uncharacterized protein n=1 Tax=Dactylosporangium matsuzakiense TaxID=53360 RepID=A0A9W6KWJ9_9ACTN|nr:hypothetical protein GCM10017581_096400 [Dactylosporangium matsuzakiense]